MTPANATIVYAAGTTYRSDEPPSNPAAACTAILAAHALRQVSSLEVIEGWAQVLPRTCARVGRGNPDAVAQWALDHFVRVAKSKDLVGLRFLLGAGLGQIAKPSHGGRPLTVLVNAQWTEGVDALLSSREGVDVNMVTSGRGETALHLAAFQGNAALVRLLLGRRARPSASDAYGYTPLHAAACKGSAAIVKMLLKAGADPRMANYYGDTPLDNALALERRAVVRCLWPLRLRAA